MTATVPTDDELALVADVAVREAWTDLVAPARRPTAPGRSPSSSRSPVSRSSVPAPRAVRAGAAPARPAGDRRALDRRARRLLVGEPHPHRDRPRRRRDLQPGRDAPLAAPDAPGGAPALISGRRARRGRRRRPARPRPPAQPASRRSRAARRRAVKAVTAEVPWRSISAPTARSITTRRSRATWSWDTTSSSRRAATARPSRPSRISVEARDGRRVAVVPLVRAVPVDVERADGCPPSSVGVPRTPPIAWPADPLRQPGPARVGHHVGGRDRLAHHEAVDARALAQVLLGRLERAGGVVGRADVAQLAVVADEHQAAARSRRTGLAHASITAARPASNVGGFAAPGEGVEARRQRLRGDVRRRSRSAGPRPRRAAPRAPGCR